MAKRFVIIAVITCLVCKLEAQSPPPPTPTITAQIKQGISRAENTQSQYTSSPSKILPTAINQTTAQPTQENTYNKREPRQHTSSFNWSRLNTALLTLFTGILAIVGFLQWRSMSKQAGYMRDGLAETKKSADAAKESAEAATKAADRVLITERAVVLVESVIATNHAVGPLGIGYLGGNSRVVFILKNFGRTIATSVELIGKLCGDLGELPLEKMPPTTIAPQGTNEWISPNIGKWIDDELIKTINVHLSILRYEIDVTYMDDFDKLHRYHCEGQYDPGLQRFLITASRESEAAD